MVEPARQGGVDAGVAGRHLGAVGEGEHDLVVDPAGGGHDELGVALGAQHLPGGGVDDGQRAIAGGAAWGQVQLLDLLPLERLDRVPPELGDLADLGHGRRPYR